MEQAQSNVSKGKKQGKMMMLQPSATDMVVPEPANKQKKGRETQRTVVFADVPDEGHILCSTSVSSVHIKTQQSS